MNDRPDLQVFEIQARPLSIPPSLASMNPDTEIRLVDRVGGVNGETFCNVGDYLQTLQTTIARQAQGFLTVAEAAQALEDVVLGVVAKDMRLDMLAAFHADKLAIRNPGDKMPTRAKDTVRDFIHLVKVSDVNAWLEKEQGVSYRLSDVESVQTTATPAPGVAASDTDSCPAWVDIAMPYFQEILKTGQHPTARIFFNALVAKSTATTPVQKGTGGYRDGIYIVDANRSVSYKTFQNKAWPRLKLK